jgi:hypothetical protein
MDKGKGGEKRTTYVVIVVRHCCCMKLIFPRLYGMGCERIIINPSSYTRKPYYLKPLQASKILNFEGSPT